MVATVWNNEDEFAKQAFSRDFKARANLSHKIAKEFDDMEKKNPIENERNRNAMRSKCYSSQIHKFVYWMWRWSYDPNLDLEGLCRLGGLEADKFREILEEQNNSPGWGRPFGKNFIADVFCNKGKIIHPDVKILIPKIFKRTSVFEMVNLMIYLEYIIESNSRIGRGKIIMTTPEFLNLARCFFKEAKCQK